MGYYEKHILPRLVDLTCGAKALRPIRSWACEGLAGEVLEIGFGSGTNIAAYPRSVSHVTAVEPSDTAWALAADNVRRSPVPITRSGLDAGRLPFDDDTFDTALSTFTLCTVPDLHAALTEVRRVLKPSGSLHFLEHGLAPDENVRRWQRRLDPLEQRLAGGCHLTRDIAGGITEAGLTLTASKQFYGARPRSFGALTVGVASVG